MHRRFAYPFLALIGITATQAVAQNVVQYVPEPLLMNGSDLVPVCRRAAETHYLAQGASVYNWTASYHDRGDGLYVDGRLRANGNTVSVHCSATRGSRERDLLMKIDETGG
ncbi:hypothetical protein ACFFJ4_14685 [Xanthomonas dyei]|uniref:Secreted protein n=1 Tax=Xanthomonas dyei TaxID=743699 RepID=A0ABZ0D7W1_9XANT|nr:hypothetical protein [Xanthomonas dyei]WOB26201.1 hypothetical protein NYR99_21535 [Xanthomonas dyei]WOB53823.1 hypothetical protein NYR95_21540 [Xanthomonas dyei]